MPRYYVEAPMLCKVGILVDAENAKDAKEKARSVSICVDISGDDADEVEVLEVEILHKVTEGNFFRGCINEMTVEKEDDE